MSVFTSYPHPLCKAKKTTGFTIVELLIVIVVIAILAAISIVAYNGIQNRAYDTTVQSDLTNFAKAMEIVKINNNDTYPDGSEFSKSMGFTFTREAYMGDDQGSTLRYCRNAGTNNYIMYARSKSGNYFKYQNTSGVSAAGPASGWAVCYFVIGEWSMNPSANGFTPYGWSNWVN